MKDAINKFFLFMQAVYAKFIVFIMAALFPIENELMALGIFIFIDFITGIWKALRAKIFNSRELAKSAGKIALYFFAILVCQLVDTHFQLPKIAQVMIGLLAVVEITSILENISSLTGLPIVEKVLTLFKRERPQ